MPVEVLTSAIFSFPRHFWPIHVGVLDYYHMTLC